MATTMFQTNLSAANLSAANLSVSEEERYVSVSEAYENINANEDYEDWAHEQNMDAEFDMVDYHTNKNRKMAQNVRDKKLIKPKQDEKQKELYKQKMKELELAKQVKIQKNKDRKTEDNLRILERKDKQDVKDIGLDENQYGNRDKIEIEVLVKDNWDDELD